MKRIAGIGLISLVGCGSFRSNDLDRMIIDSCHVSSDKMCGKYTITPLEGTQYFACYRMDEPEEKQAIIHILDKLAEKTDKDIDEVYRLAAISSKVDPDIGFPWGKCITMYGAAETMRLEFLPQKDVEEIKRSYKASDLSKILKVVGIE